MVFEAIKTATGWMGKGKNEKDLGAIRTFNPTESKRKTQMENR